MNPLPIPGPISHEMRQSKTEKAAIEAACHYTPDFERMDEPNAVGCKNMQVILKIYIHTKRTIRLHSMDGTVS